MRFKIAALLVGLAVGLLAVEAGLRVMNMGFGNSPVEPDPFLHHVHPRNYEFVQRHPSGEVGGFEIRYDADRRVVGDNPSPVSGLPCRIAFMGDSFTEGGQVAYAESFVGRIEAAARGKCDVRNYGVRSYSPAIYLVQWTRELQRWNPTHVFVMLFGNDISDDATYIAVSERDADGLPIAIRGPQGGAVVAALRRSYIARYVRMLVLRREWANAHAGEPVWTLGGVAEENPEWAPLTARLVVELERRVGAAGAQFVLMAVPSRYRLMGDGKIASGDRDFHDKVHEWSRATGVRFLPLTQPFQRAAAAGPPLFFLRDIHFTPAGHAATADAIVAEFKTLFGGD